jgi:hypothetical protein
LQKSKIQSESTDAFKWPKRFGFAKLCPSAPLNSNSFLIETHNLGPKAQVGHLHKPKTEQLSQGARPQFANEEENTIGNKNGVFNKMLGLSTASEENSSGDDYFQMDFALGGTMVGKHTSAS